MKKALIAIGVTASAAYLGISVFRAISARKEYRKKVVEVLTSQKNELELYIGLIDTAAKEVPEEIVRAADRTFAEAVEEAVAFTNSIIMPYGTLEEDDIANFSDETIRAYLECIRSSIDTAKKFYEKVNKAREQMIAVRE
jgi:hypothetical protein